MTANLILSGVYLYLFHGRKDPNQQMDDWGTEKSVVLGPFPFVHTTYCADIKLGYENEELTIFNEMPFYSGVFYGDWSVVSAHTFEISTEMKQLHEEFSADRAILPEEYKVNIKEGVAE